MKKFGRYVLNFILSLLFHWYWSIPAWILLILHFALGISVWWSVGAFALYIIGVRIFVHAVGWLVYMGNKDEKPSENKNPYSARSGKRTDENRDKKDTDVSNNPCSAAAEERKNNDIR